MYQCYGCSVLFQTERDLTWHIHMEKQKEYKIYLYVVQKEKNRYIK